MKLSDYNKAVQKVLEQEGDLDNIERVIITKDDFLLVINGVPYTVNEYKELMKDAR